MSLFSFSVGQGAFHWVNCPCRQAPTGSGYGGLLFDCGAMKENSGIKGAVKLFAAQMYGRKFPLVISHYHSDHYSGLELLATGGYRAIRSKIDTIVIPEIDAYSMQLFLRLLVFATFFRRRKQHLDESDVTRLFARRDGLKAKLTHWFPGVQIREISAGGEVIRTPTAGSEGVQFRALTPPKFPNGPEHPLRQDAELVRLLLGYEGVRNAVSETAERMYQTALRMDFGGMDLQEEWERVLLMRTDVPGRVMQLLIDPLPPGDEAALIANDILRCWLMIASVAPVETRCETASGDSPLPKNQRESIGQWGNKARDAVHLFNISGIATCPGNESILLTGDAHQYLWEAIVPQIKNVRFSVVQVPHHGSENNVCQAAYGALNCDSFVVSAGSFGNWRHPSLRLALALNQVSISGGQRQLFCTTEHSTCELRADPVQCPGIPRKAIELGGNAPPQWRDSNWQMHQAIHCPEVG